MNGKNIVAYVTAKTLVRYCTLGLLMVISAKTLVRYCTLGLLMVITSYVGHMYLAFINPLLVADIASVYQLCCGQMNQW